MKAHTDISFMGFWLYLNRCRQLEGRDELGWGEARLEWQTLIEAVNSDRYMETAAKIARAG